jgi:hypothetical protein
VEQVARGGGRWGKKRNLRRKEDSGDTATAGAGGSRAECSNGGGMRPDRGSPFCAARRRPLVEPRLPSSSTTRPPDQELLSARPLASALAATPGRALPCRWRSRAATSAKPQVAPHFNPALRTGPIVRISFSNRGGMHEGLLYADPCSWSTGYAFYTYILMVSKYLLFLIFISILIILLIKKLKL